MRRVLAWGMAPLMLLFGAGQGCAGAADEPGAAAGSPAPQSSEGTPLRATESLPRVVVLGTSLTAGLGIDPEDAYPALIQRKADSAGIRVRIDNAGLSGETSAGALRRVDWVLSEESAAVVVVETGANDGLRGLDPDSTAANIRRIVTAVRARAPEARVLIVQMEALPNLGVAYTARFRRIYGEVARATGADLMPFLLEGVAGVQGLNQSDGIHPNEAGAARVAENVWRTLGPILREIGG